MNNQIFYLILASTFIHAGWNLVARRVAGDLSVIWLALIVSSVLLSPIIFVNHLDGTTLFNLSDIVVWLVILTGIIHAAYYYLIGRAYERGEISSVYPVARGTSVSFAAIVGLGFLGEELSVSGFCGIACVILGIFLLGASSHFKKLNDYHVILLALGVGFFSGAYSVVDKIAVQEIDALLYLALSFISSAFFMYPVICKHLQIVKFKSHFLPIMAIGIGIPLGYVFVLIAFQQGQISYISAMREFAVVIGSIAGVLIFKEHISFIKAFGLFAITAGLALLKMA